MRFSIKFGILTAEVEAASEDDAREIVVKSLTNCSVAKWRRSRPTSKTGQAKLLELEELWARCIVTELDETCTGLSAGWCPIHGTCTCPTREDGEREYDVLACPLHSDQADHATPVTA